MPGVMNHRILGIAASAAALAVIGGCATPPEAQTGPGGTTPPISDAKLKEEEGKSKEAMLEGMATRIGELISQESDLSGLGITATHSGTEILVKGSVPSEDIKTKVETLVKEKIGPLPEGGSIKYELEVKP